MNRWTVVRSSNVWLNRWTVVRSSNVWLNRWTVVRSSNVWLNRWTVVRSSNVCYSLNCKRIHNHIFLIYVARFSEKNILEQHIIHLINNSTLMSSWFSTVSLCSLYLHFLLPLQCLIVFRDLFIKNRLIVELRRCSTW